MSAYIIDHKKYAQIPKYMTLWRGYGKLSAIESVKEHGYAIRLKNTNSVLYECYLPDPEYDDCCVCVDEITVEDILERLINHHEITHFLGRIGATITDIRNEYKIDDILKAICDYFDVIDFFELGEIDAIPKDDIIDEISKTLEKEELTTSNVVDERVRVLTWYDKMLRHRGLKESPLFLWQLKITDEEYIGLKDYIRCSLPIEKDENLYDREVALYVSEFHRREYENFKDDSKPSSIVFNHIGFSENELLRCDFLRGRFVDVMKSGARRLNIHLYKSPEDGKTHYLRSLFYNGGLPLRRIVSDEISVTWHRLLRKILESDERIEFSEDFADLVNGAIANDSNSLKMFCQQLQEAIIMEDFQLLPFYCTSELDSRYQFFLNQGKAVISEIKSKNPFQLQWKFDINRHRKIIKTISNIFGPDSIPLTSEFFEASGQMNKKDSFSIITMENDVEIANVIYHKTTRDFYSNEPFNFEIPYKSAANIIVTCPEIDKVLISEELDMCSPQIMREDKNGEYQLCSNRYIGHKEIIVIVPEGWIIENETDYNVEEGFSYLETKAKIVILPSGIEGQQLILKDELGKRKIISATIPLSKVVVMNASMVTGLRQNAYFNVENLYYSLKRSDGILKHIRREQLVFCSDRRTGKWINEPPLGYTYVKPQGDHIYADPVKILNLGEDKNGFRITYRDSSSDACTIAVYWKYGKVKCCNGTYQGENQWHIKKAEIEDCRYVVFECSPANGGKPFAISVRTKFCDFQLIDSNGDRVENGSYISLAQIQTYKYHIQGVSLKMTWQIGVSKFECKTKEANNARVPLTICDCGNRQTEERMILADSSLDNLLGGMQNIEKMLNSSQDDIRGATIDLTITYNGTRLSYKIKRYPYRFIKHGFNRIDVCKKTSDAEDGLESVPYDGPIKALPLYNFKNVLPVEIEPDENGELLLPEAVCSWGNILLVSGKSEHILPHAIEAKKEGELTKEERLDHFKKVFFSMKNEEYPNALIWSDTWQRCCYWYDVSLREHIPASSLFDLMVVMEDAKLLCRFVFNMLLKGLKTGDFKEYEKNLKHNLLQFSKDNYFLWIWINKKDYSVMSLIPFIGEDLHRYEEFLQGWYFTTMDVEKIKLLFENKMPSEDLLSEFIVGFIQRFSDFMDSLRYSSLAEFLKINASDIMTANEAEEKAREMMQNQELQDVDMDEIRDATGRRLTYLLDEDEKVFDPYIEQGFRNLKLNSDRFYGRANMFIQQVLGDENTNIFSQKSIVRRSVLYYTSTFVDPFIKLWFSKYKTE